MAQPYDKAWIVGSNTMVKLSFNANTIDTASFYWGAAYVTTNSSTSDVSDTNGNLLFYTNGSTVGNSLGQLMENGDSLVDPMFYTLYPGGVTEPQTNIIIPRSGNTFYLFYFSESDSLYATQTIDEPDRLYYAIIDMDQNGGLGKVISKKNLAYKGLFGDCRLTACRHANGRDWWLVHQGFQNDEYFIYLVTPDGVSAPTIQHIGPSGFYEDNLAAQSVFSPDGSKFATITFASPLVIMDFDRCSGLFSNPDSIYVPADTLWYNGILNTDFPGGCGVSFSSNSRFLYMSNNDKITQFDTWNHNVSNSAMAIGRWDTVGPGFFVFNQMCLLPNGQIIVDDFEGGSGDFHLIDSPDVLGTGCHFHFNGLPTSTLDANALPNMINYRLGALAGSSCDTITGIATIPGEGEEFSFMPIPATDDLTLRYQATADFTVRIYSVTGQKMAELDVKATNNSKHIDTEILSTGVYEYEIVRGAMVLQRGRLSVIK
jgi:hypothetical protein